MMTKSAVGPVESPCTTLVRVSGPIPSSFDGDEHPFWLEEPKGRLNLSSSALVFDTGRGIVVASIKAFRPFLVEEARKTVFGLSTKRSADPARRVGSKVLPEGVEVSVRSFGGEPGWAPAKVLGTIVVPEVAASLRTISPSTTQCDANGWATLAVVEVLEPNTRLQSAPWLARTLDKGTRVSLVSSPYGVLCPPVFGNQNAVCTVANAIGSAESAGSRVTIAAASAQTETEAALYFVDTRVLPGSEGGAMVLNEGGVTKVAGIIAEPFRLDGISVAGIELSAVMSIVPCWRAAAAFMAGKPGIPRPHGSVDQEVHPILPEEVSLVLLRAGNSWASGVLLENGLVLSNAHFVAPFRGSIPPIHARVCVVPPRQSAPPYRKWVPVRTEYTAKGSLDIAVFSLARADYRNIGSMLEPVQWNNDVEPAEGDDITVVGYPLFSPSTGMGPTVTHGSLSKVVKAPQRLPHRAGVIVENAMYVTSAAVHFGNSGGMLLDSRKRWIGLVACNARVGDAPPIPSLNFSIPTRALEFVRSYADDPRGSASVLCHADDVGEEMGQVWGLSPALREEPLVKSKL